MQTLRTHGIYVVLYSQDDGVKWAAYADLRQGGQAIRQAAGPACEDCFDRVRNKLFYETWEAFEEDWDDCDDGEGVKATWEEMLQRERDGSAPAPWTKASVDVDSELRVTISKTFRGYTEGPIKQKLNMARLTAKATAGIHEVQGASPEAPDTLQTFLLFKRPQTLDVADEGFDVTVSVSTTHRIAHPPPRASPQLAGETRRVALVAAVCDR